MSSPIAFVARWLLAIAVSGWLAIALVWGALHWWIVPRIDDFRPQLQDIASRQFGVPVRIESIRAHSSGLIPSFELRQVSLLDAQGRTAFSLPRIVVAVSPRSVWRLGFEQVFIENPDLEIRRLASGEIRVAGVVVKEEEGTGANAVADWIFSQGELVVRGGRVNWVDERGPRGKGPVEPLVLEQVDLVLRNPGRRHQLRLDATPPAEWGDRFSVSGVFRRGLLSTHPGNWRDWRGQLFAEFFRVDVSRLSRYADPGIELTAGNGAARTWVDIDAGEVAGVTADLALAELDVRLDPRLQALAIETVAGRVGVRRLPGGLEFVSSDLRFRTRDGLQWPGGDLQFSYQQDAGQPRGDGALRADRLDLAAVVQVARRLPLGTSTHAALEAQAPKGQVQNLQLKWHGEPWQVPVRYEAKGRVSALEVGLGTGGSVRPGLRGLGLDFDLNQSGGRARVVMQDGAVNLPEVFEDPLVPVSALSGDLQWLLRGEAVEVRVEKLQFENAHAAGEARAVWRTSDPQNAPSGARFPGVLDLQGSLSRADGTKVHRYLPLVVPPLARHYVRDAVQQGSASAVKFRVRGDLHDMPFNDPRQGEFHISAQVQNATFGYVPRNLLPRDSAAWPALAGLSGELVFDRSSMEVRGAKGRISGHEGLVVLRADARIPDLAHTTTVIVSGAVRGPLGDALGFVRNSPVAEFTSQALSGATGTGQVDLALGLNLPLADLSRSQVRGTVTLAGNDLRITPSTPLLSRARGAISFSESTFGLAGVQARMLGGDLRLEGGTRLLPAGASGGAGETVIQLRGQGQVTAEGLRQARELGLVSRLGVNGSGSAAYTATLGFRRGVPEFSMSSSLQGLALSLPAPLNKPAESALPVRYESALVRESLAPGRTLQDQVTFEIGRIAAIQYVRDVSVPEPRVLRGSIAVGLLPGESVPLPEDGVAANINLADVDLDAWEKILSPPGAPPASAGAGANAGSPVSGYLPNSFAIRARELTIGGRKLNQVVVGGGREAQNWRANLDARELSGYVDYRQPQGAGSGRLYARLARLNIAPNMTTDVESLLDDQPAGIPALDIVVEDLELKGRRLGRVEIEATNRALAGAPREGGVREWRLTKLNVSVPEATFTASGNWAAVNAQASPATARSAGEQRRTVLNFRMDIGNSGELLKRFGMNGVLRNGKGRMEGRVAWLGSPLGLDYPSLGGQFSLNIENGQFLKADPGLAKLLGVLNLQALPRRLTLDFRDVFSEGFSFDFIRGDVQIEQGVAFTNNLQMKGVNAAVLMEGRADIARETQDVKVVVVPEINAGTASLVATVINPAVGLGTFLAQYFLRRPLSEATTQEFHVDGTWADPKIRRIDRKAAAAAAAAASAPGEPKGDASRPEVGR